MNTATDPSDEGSYLDSMRKLIHQQQVMETDVLQLLKDYCISFHAERYVVLSFHVKDIRPQFFETGGKYAIENVQTALFIIKNVVKEFLSPPRACFILAEVPWVSFAYSVNEKVSDQELIARVLADAEEIRRFIYDKGGLDLCITISAIHHGLASIHNALGESIQMIRYRETVGCTEDLLWYGNYVKPNLHSDLLLHLVRMLQCVQQADYPGAREALLQYTDEAFHQYSIPVQNYEEFYWGFRFILNLSLDWIMRNGHRRELESVSMNWHMYKAKSVQALEQCAILALDTLIASDHAQLEAPPRWFQPLLMYIEENYANVNLNVNMAAEHFNMNPAYISRTFKKFSGKSLPEYINRVRIQHAKQYLAQGATVAETSIAVGYGSAITMRRNFKKLEGCIPSKSD